MFAYSLLTTGKAKEPEVASLKMSASLMCRSLTLFTSNFNHRGWSGQLTYPRMSRGSVRYKSSVTYHLHGQGRSRPKFPATLPAMLENHLSSKINCDHHVALQRMLTGERRSTCNTLQTSSTSRPCFLGFALGPTHFSPRHCRCAVNAHSKHLQLSLTTGNIMAWVNGISGAATEGFMRISTLSQVLFELAEAEVVHTSVRQYSEAAFRGCFGLAKDNAARRGLAQKHCNLHADRSVQARARHANNLKVFTNFHSTRAPNLAFTCFYRWRAPMRALLHRYN